MSAASAMLLVFMHLETPEAVSDATAITATEAKFAAAWSAHDAKAMAAFWTDDGDFMNPTGGFARGRTELEAQFAAEHAGVMRGTTYTFHLDSSRTIAPGVVVTDWTNAIDGMVSPDGKPLPPFRHHVTTVFVKKDGRWWKSAARAIALLAPPGR